jgi:DNA-binding HxlR family transcriptional regulator
VILYACASTEAVRFSELVEAVPGISPRMLSGRLRDLEQAGLVERRVLDTSPPSVQYRLTASGRRLEPVLEAMRAYADAVSA